MQIDADLLGEIVAAVVEDHVAAATAPLIKKIAQLEADLALRPDAIAHAAIVARAAIETAAQVPKPEPIKGERGADGAPGIPGPQGEPGPQGARGADGESLHPDTIRLMILEEVAKAVGILPRAADGKSVTAEEVRPMLEEMVARAVGAIPRPKDGAPGPVGPQGERGPMGERGLDGTNGAAGERGPQGDIGIAGPQGERGLDGSVGPQGPQGERGADGAQGAKGDAGEPGPMGPPGPQGIAGAPGERGEKGDPGAEGERGEPGDVGPRGERGETGDRGADGKDADIVTLRELVGIAVRAAMAEIAVPSLDMDEIERMLRRRVEDVLATWPKPKDGRDGFSLENFTMELRDDGRTMVFAFADAQGAKVFEVEAPWLIYRGLYQSGKAYQRGDTVTYAGSQYIAVKETTDKPPKSADWILAVKSGKDAA